GVMGEATQLAGSNDPLYIVDGVIVSDNDALDIEALDIESIEVIKGDAARETYGERASRGVIKITTKR
ncbi:MAG: TonB-dependent receptor plug domain-containing protein, partial [Rhodothermales bacterium]|nr:TonB-dependent receptor plug domain-containing protein [Rhodothermales bacterium]